MAPSRAYMLYALTKTYSLITTFLYYIIMPRKSKRYKNINNLRKLNDELYYWSIHQYLTEDNDPLKDEMDVDCFLLMEECK